MEENFSDYILNKLSALIGIFGAIPLLIGVYTFTKSWLITLITAISVMLLFLLWVARKIFKERQTINKSYNLLSETNKELIQKIEKLEMDFNKNSEQYSKNIKSLNRYKRIVHLVDTFVNSTEAETQETKRIMEQLRYSLKTNLKDSDLDEF